MSTCKQRSTDDFHWPVICGGTRRVVLCESLNTEPETFVVFYQCQQCHWITATASETKVECD